MIVTGDGWKIPGRACTVRRGFVAASSIPFLGERLAPLTNTSCRTLGGACDTDGFTPITVGAPLGQPVAQELVSGIIDGSPRRTLIPAALAETYLTKQTKHSVTPSESRERNLNFDRTTTNRDGSNYVYKKVLIQKRRKPHEK